MKIVAILFLFWPVLMTPSLGRDVTADPSRAVFLFTDVPDGAQLFLDGHEVTSRAVVSAEGWQVPSETLEPRREYRIAAVFHFTEAGTPQIAELTLSAHAGDVLQISFRSFAKTQAAGPPAPTSPDSQTSGTAIIRLLVTRNTKLTINDSPTIQEGERREFSVRLGNGESATYRIAIDYRDNTGRQVIRSRQITVKAGDVVELTLKDFSESLNH